jgi:hypothetical protein
MERCACCGKPFRPNPRVKQQRYCSRKTCQQARRRRWQKRKLATDEDYRRNQADAQRRWRRRNPGYWRSYRLDHPEYTHCNRERQRERNMQRRVSSTQRENKGVGIAKMDALNSRSPILSGRYKLVPEADPGIAKMDPLIVQFTVLSSSYKDTPDCKYSTR